MQKRIHTRVNRKERKERREGLPLERRLHGSLEKRESPFFDLGISDFFFFVFSALFAVKPSAVKLSAVCRMNVLK
jgi:hypothetical protein